MNFISGEFFRLYVNSERRVCQGLCGLSLIASQCFSARWNENYLLQRSAILNQIISHSRKSAIHQGEQLENASKTLALTLLLPKDRSLPTWILSEKHTKIESSQCPSLNMLGRYRQTFVLSILKRSYAGKWLWPVHFSNHRKKTCAPPFVCECCQFNLSYILTDCNAKRQWKMYLLEKEIQWKYE